ncbi:alkaline phosphatase D family protein [Tautonia sociabilis]|uniref:Twin-arginine translocation pathway signal protein n=1 Tax=Tautonia sociabilis TaxID=2080755 RepID=A0A432MGM6_9BACT|nr:alkaline phosphatase D family protein [Tautonia sociabilis]RUL85639.1 twin-arginine translocation pathway signal protein [Tautonia sociabilis]
MTEHPVNRRTFLAGSAAATAALAARSQAHSRAPRQGDGFRSAWGSAPDRVWPGPEYWSNPLQDWRIRAGVLECIRPAPGRSVHLLTRELADRPGDLRMSVRVGAIDGGRLSDSGGSAGFSVGVRGPLGDYRNALVHGSGLEVGLRSSGELFIGSGPEGVVSPVELNAEEVDLVLEAAPEGDAYAMTLSARSAADGRELGTVSRSGIPASRLVGNLALVSNPGPAGRGNAPGGPRLGQFRFADWAISGSKVDAFDDRTFGPILFAQYTVHGGILKLTAQMPPLGEDDSRTVRLLLDRGDGWRAEAEVPIDPRSRTAHFRVEGWDATRDTPYRLAYALRSTDGSTVEDTYDGLVRRDPVGAEILTVADISCNAHYAFPNEAAVASMTKLDPDLLAFTGDQYYESTGGFGVERMSLEDALLDVLRKWYQHGWTWRELMRDRPSVSIPDDHDVYHGNLGGGGGKKAEGQGAAAESGGGYKMMAEFVNVVHRIQTSHHPDSPAEPGLQGITGYYGPLSYGGVSFAILADRQYKPGPAGKVPPTTSGRADHVIDPGFDPKSADRPGLDLLGDSQMRFLESWADDWSDPTTRMKAAISQTIFTAMATHHGQADNYLVADYDTNAWPQTARDAAVRALRRGFAFHLAGDQHLPAVVHYGIDKHRDGTVAFAGPAINNLYPRWFRPEHPGANRPSGAPEDSGDFTDSFGHPLTVLSCANPKLERRRGVLDAETDKSAGFGVVRFQTRERAITVECWPLLADPTEPGSQFPGWPVTVSQRDCGGARAAEALLPELVIRGSDAPVVQVIDEKTGETVSTLRLPSPRWRPFAFAAGPYTIRVSDPESGVSAERSGVEARPGNEDELEIRLGRP